jgi:hypothetical protein
MHAGRMKHSRFAAPAIVIGLALAIVACGTDNLFEAPSGDPPEILELLAPPEVPAGQKLDVAIRARSSIPLDSLVVKARGAFSADKQVFFPSVTYDQSVVVSFDVPTTLVDSVATITAYAYDRIGQVSTAAQDQVRILPAPPAP